VHRQRREDLPHLGHQADSHLRDPVRRGDPMSLPSKADRPAPVAHQAR
jgi:hypothetical protein